MHFVQVIAGSLSEIDALVTSWRISLDAKNKSPNTVTAYTYATTQFSAYLHANGILVRGGG